VPTGGFKQRAARRAATLLGVAVPTRGARIFPRERCVALSKIIIDSTAVQRL